MFGLKVRFYLIICLLFSITINLPVTSPNISANVLTTIQEPTPKATGEQLITIDDGVGEGRFGGTGDPGFGWFNLLKPDGYPATLKEVRIAFSDGPQGIVKGSPIKIAVYADPEGDGPSPGQQPNSIFSVTVNNPGTFDSYTLPTPVTINSGAFIVGALDSIFVANLPAFGDIQGLVKPVGSQSYVTLDNGKTFLRVDQNFPGFQLQPVTWLIRGLADVEGLAPIITRAFYKKDKLKVFGRNFSNTAFVRINGKKIDKQPKFAASLGRLIFSGTASELNLKPTGQNNRLVVVIDGSASEAFDFTS